MGKYFVFSFIIFLSIMNEVYSQSADKYKIKKVVIDAGHGGKDPGAIGKSTQEKDITLAIALKVGEYIEEYIEDVEVIYTRETDVFVELKERAEIANSNQADLMISIHVNSSKSSLPFGTSTYVMGLHKSEDNLEVAKTENSSILIESNYEENYNYFDPESPEAYIILNLYQNVNLENSVNLAAKIQNQFRVRAGRTDLGVKQAGLVVLWYTTMPSVLVETGFISNYLEEIYLASEYGQTIIASAIFRAFREYKIDIENNSEFVVGDNNSTVSETAENTLNDEILFKVQVKSSTVRIPLTSTIFDGLTDVKEFVYEGVYKYTVGSTSDYDEIIEMQTSVRKVINDAFIIAFINDEKVTVEKAKEALNKN